MYVVHTLCNFHSVKIKIKITKQEMHVHVKNIQNLFELDIEPSLHLHY